MIYGVAVFFTFLQLLGKATQDSLESGRYPAASQTQKLQAVDATILDLPLTETQNSTSATELVPKLSS